MKDSRRLFQEIYGSRKTMKTKLFPDGSTKISVYEYKPPKHKDKYIVINNATGEVKKVPINYKIPKNYLIDNTHSVMTSINRTKTNIEEYAVCNKWDYFVTLTFNQEKVDRYNYDACAKIATKYLQNLRYRYAPDLKYIIVVDLHTKGVKNAHNEDAIHFHGLLANIGELENKKKDTGLVDSSGRKRYKINFTSGFNEITKVGDSIACSHYIKKYISKAVMTDKRLFNKNKYFVSQKLKKPLIIKTSINYEQRKKALDNISVNSKTFLYSDMYYTSSVVSPTTDIISCLSRTYNYECTRECKLST